MTTKKKIRPNCIVLYPRVFKVKLEPSHLNLISSRDFTETRTWAEHIKEVKMHVR